MELGGSPAPVNLPSSSKATLTPIIEMHVGEEIDLPSSSFKRQKRSAGVGGRRHVGRFAGMSERTLANLSGRVVGMAEAGRG